MAYSVIEQEFESYCHSIHPDISPDMFFKEYNDYEQCIPLLREFFTALHQYVHDQLPNIDMSFTARLKSKKSFFDKKILKMSEKLSVIFSEGKYDVKEQLEAIDSTLSFLPTEKFKKIKQQILACSSSGITTLKNFRFIFDDLSDEEKNLFIKKISRTSDTFAYSFIIKNISYPIKDFKMLDDGTFAIIEDSPDNTAEEKTHKIQPAIKFNPETDIIEQSYANKFVIVNGKKYLFNPEYLAYSPLVSSAKRDINSALKDANGMLTLLQDTIVLSNGQAFPVENIFFDDSTNSYFLTTPEGERINLTSRLATDKLTLKKFDEATCENAILNALKPALQLFNTENNFRILTEKDFIKNPKLDKKTGAPNYKALHNCLLNLTFKYKIEGQLRTFLANILYNFDHDMYKKKSTENQKINPILFEIYNANPDAFDSSTPTLMKLLENNLDIDILDLMATYFVTTSFPDGHSDTYLVEPKTAFSHIFGKYAETPSNGNVSKKSKLDFSSYANFIASRAQLKNQLAMPNNDSLDDEEIEI